MRISVAVRSATHRRHVSAAAAGSGCRGTRRTARSRNRKRITVRSRTVRVSSSFMPPSRPAAQCRHRCRSTCDSRAAPRDERDEGERAQSRHGSRQRAVRITTRHSTRQRTRRAAERQHDSCAGRPRQPGSPASRPAASAATGADSARSHRAASVRTAPAQSGSAADDPGRRSAGSLHRAAAVRTRGRSAHPRSSGTAATVALSVPRPARVPVEEATSRPCRA